MTRTILLGSLLGLTSTMVGCGGSSGPAPVAETPAAPPATPALSGTWQGSMEVTPEAASKLSPDQLANLQGMRMEMTFRENGELLLRGETAGRPYESENRWKLVTAQGAKVTIESTDAQGQSKPIDLLFEGQDAFRMPLQTEVANLGAMKFQRLR